MKQGTAPSPTRTSFFPHSNLRPAVIFKSGRVENAAGCTPRSGTLAGVPVDFFGTSTTTNSSALVSGTGASPGATEPRAIPGACAMISTASPSITLIISLSLPERSTRAFCGEPAPRRALRNPSPIDSTASRALVRKMRLRNEEKNVIAQ
jgi:hypothetical protein